MRRCPQQGLPHARDKQHGGKRPRERIEPAPASTRWWGAGGRLAPSGAGAASPQVHTDASRGRSCGGVPYTSLSPATLSCRHMQASRLSIPSLTFACCACRCRSGAAYGYVRTRTRTCRRARPPGECHAAARYAVRSTTFIESSDGASASLEAIRAKLRRWCKRTFVGARPWTAPRTDTPLASYGQR